MLYCGPYNFDLARLLFKQSNTWSEEVSDKEIFYTHKCKVAIEHLVEICIEKRGKFSALLPSYNCGSEIDPFLHKGIDCSYYKINRDFTVDFDDLYNQISSETAIVYVIHYFGFIQDIESIRKLCIEKNILLVEDCALTSLSKDTDGKLAGLKGDASVYNFPKIFPVPDGGALLINNVSLSEDCWEMRMPSIRGIIKKSLPFFKRAFLRLFSGTLILDFIWKVCKPKKPAQINCIECPDIPLSYYYDEDLSNRSISYLSRSMVSSYDITKLVEKRRQNFDLYQKLLNKIEGVEIPFDSLPQGICPLFFPVFVKNRSEVANILKQKAIDVTEWWSGFHRKIDWEKYPDAVYLKNNLLALPLHHQLGEKHIRYIYQEFCEAVKLVRLIK